MKYCFNKVALCNFEDESLLFYNWGFFIGGGNRNIQRKPPTCRKSLTNSFIKWCIECTLPWTGFEVTTIVVKSADCTGSCKSKLYFKDIIFQNCYCSDSFPTCFKFTNYYTNTNMRVMRSLWFVLICFNCLESAAPAYRVQIYISQLIRYFHRTYCSEQDVLDWRLLLTRKLLNQGFLMVNLKSSLRKFYNRHHNLVNRYEIPVSHTTT